MKNLQPKLAVDVVVLHEEEVLYIERRNPPHGWALPGGFVDYGESVEKAACRELREETGLIVAAKDLRLLGVWSDSKRDPRGHVISVAFATRKFRGKLRADDDAKRAEFRGPTLRTRLAFKDHGEMVARAKMNPGCLATI